MIAIARLFHAFAWIGALLGAWAGGLQRSSGQPAPTGAPALQVRVGFSGLYRVGDYTPIWVTVPAFDGGEARAGSIEVWAYQDSRATVVQRVPVALQATEVTVCVPVLMGGLLEGHSVVIRDPDGRPVASRSLDQLPAAEAIAVGGGTSGAARMVAVASDAPSSVMPGDFIGAGIRPAYLPIWPELYESLDLLVLSGLTLAELSTEQSAAIATWVKSGGRLLVATPAEGLDVSPALTPLLPGDLGELLGPVPGGSMPRRALRPRAGAVGVGVGLAIPRGLGQVFLAPFPLTAETRGALGDIVGRIRPRVPTDPPPVPPAAGGRAAWRGALAAMFCIALLAGMAEAVIRRAHNLWPWSLHVKTMLLSGLFAGAGYLIYRLPSAPSPAVVELDDVVGDEVVAVTTLSAESGQRFPRPVLPPGLAGTAHATVSMAFAAGAPAVADAPHGAGVYFLSTPNGPRQPLSARVQDARRDGVLQESSAGIATLNGGKLGVPVQGALPEPFATARRLTPWRTTQIQRGVEAGELTVTWQADGATVIRRVDRVAPK